MSNLPINTGAYGNIHKQDTLAITSFLSSSYMSLTCAPIEDSCGYKAEPNHKCECNLLLCGPDDNAAADLIFKCQLVHY